jgi:thioredoxin reductase (NADPH)
MVKTDIIIIGAGPVGLFTVFEAGLLKLRCHIVDALPQPGGQLAEIYPKKPIYDIPGYPTVGAKELVDNLMEQIEPFKPDFTLGERAEKLDKQEDGSFTITTSEALKLMPLSLLSLQALAALSPESHQLKILRRSSTKAWNTW